MARRGARVLWWAGNEKEQRQHTGAEDGEVLDDVKVAQHRRLTMKLIVDVGLRGVRASADHGIAAGVAAEHALEFLHLVDERGIAGG